MPGTLDLHVRLDGYDAPIGNLSRSRTGALTFRHTDAYLGDPEAATLSLALPPTEHPYGDAATRAFFGNLLQERD